MAHGIDIVAGKATMAYVGEVPWHGLGQALSQDADMATWKKEAGMNWKILEAPVLFNAKVGGVEQTLEFENRKVLFRSDNKTPLSTVSSSYNVVQPEEVLEFFRDLTEYNDMKLETAGCLFGGTRFWALANTGREAVVNGNDGIRGMLLLSTSCDGTLATTAKFTSVRVVCNNTLRIALNNLQNEEDQKLPVVRVSHSSVFDPNKIKESLGLLDKGWDKFIGEVKAMTKVKLSDNDAKDFIAKIMLSANQYENMTAEQALHSRVQNKLDAIYALYKGEGMGADSAGSTVWGVLNAITEHVDHNMGRIADNALWSSWYEHGDKIKTSAFDLAVSMT